MFSFTRAADGEACSNAWCKLGSAGIGPLPEDHEVVWVFVQAQLAALQDCPCRQQSTLSLHPSREQALSTGNAQID